MKKLSFIAASLLMALNAHATLSLVAGGVGVYDSVNNVTWTADANLMATQAASYPGGAAAFVSAVIAASGGVVHDTPSSYDPSGTYTLSASDFNTSDGTMDYWGARAWVNYLNATGYGGSNQWALPSTVQNSGYGFPDSLPGDLPQSTSQMAELFYGQLGGSKGALNTYVFLSTLNSSAALFHNVQANYYWSSTETIGAASAYVFITYSGYQSVDGKVASWFAFPVSPGKLGGASSGGTGTSVPLPPWALGALGLGIIGIASRRVKKPAKNGNRTRLSSRKT